MNTNNPMVICILHFIGMTGPVELASERKTKKRVVYVEYW